MIKSSKIKCIFYDFDGVMTDNCVYLTEEGIESVRVNRSDGYAISMIKKNKINQVIVSTEINPVVKKRAQKLKIEVIHGVSDKSIVVEKYCHQHGYDLAEVMFIGNDLNDLTALHIVGIKGCPADAEKEILDIADWISKKNGGCGVVRDLYHWMQQINLVCE